MPNVALTPVAKGKLEEYLSEEPSETVVRILVEPDGRFGLSLDTKAQDDVGFELDALPFVIEGTQEAALDGLKIDYLAQGASSGFSLSGGRPQVKRGGVLRTEPTPNPNALKYVLGFRLGGGARTFTRGGEGEKPKAIAQLFEVHAKVDSVFLSDDFVTITRTDDGVGWDEIEAPVKEILEGLEAMGPAGVVADLPDDAPFIDRLRHFVRIDVAPFLQADGGDIEVVDVADGGVIQVRLQGACGSCPSSTATLKMGVERRLKEQFPEDVSTLQLV